MSKSHRLGRSLAVATVAILLVATAAFAHSTAFGPAPAGTWSNKLDITNVGVVGDHEDVWEDADDGDADRDEFDDQVGDDDQGEDADDQGEDVDDADEVEAPERAGAHEQHATPATAPKAGAGDEDDDQGEDNDDQGEDNDDQDEVEDHDGSHDGDHDDGDDGGESDDGEHDD